MGNCCVYKGSPAQHFSKGRHSEDKYKYEYNTATLEEDQPIAPGPKPVSSSSNLQHISEREPDGEQNIKFKPET